MKCPYCNTEVSDLSKFCTNCGKPLTNADNANRSDSFSNPADGLSGSAAMNNGFDNNWLNNSDQSWNSNMNANMPDDDDDGWKTQMFDGDFSQDDFMQDDFMQDDFRQNQDQPNSSGFQNGYQSNQDQPYSGFQNNPQPNQGQPYGGGFQNSYQPNQNQPYNGFQNSPQPNQGQPYSGGFSNGYQPNQDQPYNGFQNNPGAAAQNNYQPYDNGYTQIPGGFPPNNFQQNQDQPHSDGFQGGMGDFHPGVGFRQSDSQQNPNGGQPHDYANNPPYGGKTAGDTGSIGWAVLGALVPIAGLILFLLWREKQPNNAEKAGIGAIIGVIVNIAVIIIINIVNPGFLTDFFI